MTRSEDTGPGLKPGEERRTGSGPRSIATTLDRLIARSGRRRGFAEAGLLTDWAAVVGPELSGHTMPERLARSRGEDGAVLHLRVASGWATEVQHLQPLIIERINAYFGYRAIGRLALKQGPIETPRPRTAPVSPPLSLDQQQELETAVAAVQDPDLAQALRHLGEAVLGRR